MRPQVTVRRGSESVQEQVDEGEDGPEEKLQPLKIPDPSRPSGDQAFLHTQVSSGSILT